MSEVRPVPNLARDIQPQIMSKETAATTESSQTSLPITLIAELHDRAVEETEKKAQEDLEDARPESDTDYITGFPLFAVLFGVSLVGFLITLDTTIVATVCLVFQVSYVMLIRIRLYPRSPITSTV